MSATTNLILSKDEEQVITTVLRSADRTELDTNELAEVIADRIGKRSMVLEEVDYDPVEIAELQERRNGQRFEEMEAEHLQGLMMATTFYIFALDRETEPGDDVFTDAVSVIEGIEEKAKTKMRTLLEADEQQSAQQ
jgi:hypothetical protein